MSTPPGPPNLGLSVVDLFCGAGGLSHGFTQAGFDVVYALDKDIDSCETYRANHDYTKLEHGSITDRSPADLAATIGEVDVVVGGPSCQGFSTHGRRDPADERNKLWGHMRDVVAAIKPRAFLLENVPGLVSHGDGHANGPIVRDFANLGYNVEAKILLAADYGVPQLRRRIFVVGVLDDFQFEFPVGSHLGGWRRDTLDLWEAKRVDLGLDRHISCGEIFADLPDLIGGDANPTKYTTTAAPSDYVRSLRGTTKTISDHEASPVWGKYVPILEHIPPGGTWRDVPPHLLPDRFRGMRRTDSTNLLGRLDPDRPAYTITTQFNNVTAGCFIHPFEERALSVREGARLQSFPDNYVFHGALSSRCRQIGNAVPPRLAQFLAAAIAVAIDGNSKPRGPRAVRARTPTLDAVRSDTNGDRARPHSRRDSVSGMLVAEELVELGLKFRTDVHLPDVERAADIVFDEDKVVVFVDGCFWHGCPTHTRQTKSMTKWWADKIATNRRQDLVTDRLLRKAGYHVVRVWEHETPTTAAEGIAQVVALPGRRSLRTSR